MYEVIRALREAIRTLKKLSEFIILVHVLAKVARKMIFRVIDFLKI